MPFVSMYFSCHLTPDGDIESVIRTLTNDSVPLSVKLAVTAGAIVGGTLAVLNNKEKVMEIAGEILQKGADYCKERTKTSPIEIIEVDSDAEVESKSASYASDYADGAWSSFNDEGHSTGARYFSETDEELTTPDFTDYDSESDILRINTNEKFDDENVEIVSLD